MASPLTDSYPRGRDDDVEGKRVSHAGEVDDHATGHEKTQHESDDDLLETKETEPSFLSRLWKKLDLDIGTIILMMK